MATKVWYHAACADGFCSAWVAHGSRPSASLIPVKHGKPPPPVAPADEVYIVDFSYPREQLEAIEASVQSLVVLDHHSTAAESLTGLPYCHFDMARSGAGMTWDHFNPGTPRPWLVDYVEDNDLWRHVMPGSKAVAAVLRMTPFELGAYQALQDRGVDDVAAQGELILAYEVSLIRAAKRSVRYINFGGFENVPCVNSLTLQSTIGQSLGKGAPFAIVWYYRDDGKVQLSLRSDEGGADVAAVAKQYGGGGHIHSSGCTLDLQTWVDVLL